MALNAMDAIRTAEINAQNDVKLAQDKADAMVSEATKKAEAILSEASDSVKSRLESSSDKAYKASEEIVVTARNSAILEADKLKSDCLQKQALVNERIKELLI